MIITTITDLSKINKQDNVLKIEVMINANITNDVDPCAAAATATVEWG